MIIDTFSNWSIYFRLPAWQKAFEFLHAATPALEDKKHLIQGEDIFALVSTYETKPLAAGALEAHRLYLDIQVLLAGTEYMDYWPLAGLAVKTPYTRDVEFFQTPAAAPLRVRLEPGVFAALFPADAHMPMLMSGATPQRVKKVVVKINLELLRP